MAGIRSSPVSVSHKCAFCESTFARREHLSRHIRSHTRDKPFKCSTCTKGFSRLDVLHRHRDSHRQIITGTELVASTRACTQCATSRIRCSRSAPCKRCAERNLECSYPSAKRRRALSLSRVQAVGSPSEDLNATSIPFPTHPANIAALEDTSLQLNAITDRIVHGTSHNQVGWLESQTAKPSTPRASEDVRWSQTAKPSTPRASEDVRWSNRGCSLDVADALLEAQGNGQDAFNCVYHENTSGIDFNSRAMGLLSTNWISPPDQDSFDIDSQLAAVLSENSGGTSWAFPFLLSSAEPISGQDETDQGEHSLHISEQIDPTILNETLSEPINVLQSSSMSPSNELDSITSVSATDREFYVDSGGARAPFKGRPIRGLPADTGSKVGGSGPSSVPCSMERGDGPSRGSWDSQELPEKDIVSIMAYDNMIHGIYEEDRLQSLGMDLSLLPQRDQLIVLVKLYFLKFHAVFPFLRKGEFPMEASAKWILLLAIATVGATYVRSSHGSQYKSLLSKLLQKILLRRTCNSKMEYAFASWMPYTAESRDSYLDLPTVQADILNMVCMLHKGDKISINRAISQRSRLVEACNVMGLLSIPEEVKISGAASGDEHTIHVWLQRQGKIRTGMMIWLLDSMLVCEFGRQPLLQLTDARSPLPCADKIWETPKIDQVAADTSEATTLLGALEILHMEKRLPTNLSEFSTIILIYAVYRKNRDVICQYQTQLSSWRPTANVQTRVESGTADETWPPSTSLLSSWRNSACDCLDILHWCANGKAAHAAGWEHPTILHLHLARLVLLTPMEHMQVLAAASVPSARASGSLFSARCAKARSHVLQWVICDQFKARLAVVHAGALLWHVRRFSNDAFIEPFAVYTATLVLWAYSLFVQLPRPQLGHQVPHAPLATNSTTSIPNCLATVIANPAAETELDPEPSVINLDRPCDDEMVQNFVRLGHRMSGYLLRVGNICDSEAPRKILLEGVRLLMGEAGESERGPKSTTTVWGIALLYAELLGCPV